MKSHKNCKSLRFFGLMTLQTRWYPRGIQKLVSTYEFPETLGGGVFWGSQNSMCQVLAKLKIWGGSGVVKSKSAKSWPNFNFRGGAILSTQIPSPSNLTKFPLGGGVGVLDQIPE